MPEKPNRVWEVSYENNGERFDAYNLWVIAESADEAKEKALNFFRVHGIGDSVYDVSDKGTIDIF